MNDDPSGKPYEVLDSIWTKGCRGNALRANEHKRFAAMARSRFHTFTLGVEHAKSTEDDEATLGLITGMARELSEGPGLCKIWHVMAVSKSDLGEQVNLLMEKWDQSQIH